MVPLPHVAQSCETRVPRQAADDRADGVQAPRLRKQTSSSGGVGVWCVAQLSVTRATTFVLVHGAWHGAWCWDRVAPLLHEAGHRTISVDLPVGDGRATFHDYADVVVGAITDADSHVALVGHSLGSMVVPLAASRRRVDAVIFLSGVIPKLSAQPWDDGPLMETPGAYDPLVEQPDGATVWPTVESATHALYGDCSAEDAAWAFSHLRPQNSSSLWTEPYPLDSWPQTPYHAIFGKHDRAVTPEWGRYVASTRLHIEPVEIASDHSPMISYPDELARLLVDLLPV